MADAATCAHLSAIPIQQAREAALWSEKEKNVGVAKVVLTITQNGVEYNLLHSRLSLLNACLCSAFGAWR